MRRISALLLLPLFAMPALLLQQEVPTPAPAVLEITGVNAASAPDVTLTVHVTDVVGQTVRGLDVQDFQLGGALADVAEIVRVESTEDNLPFAVVLVIDTSSSMSGMPLQRTQAAAKAFVNALGPDDPVAIVTFSNDAAILREFTTDKADLLDAIDGLVPFGQTALYDGAAAGIELAAAAPYPRRAVILLSDGAEYGGASLTGRESAAELSPVRGVPVYTIGLGFGLDRTYLQELSGVSSARFYESPTPEELTAIYDELATLFRTQYVLTLQFRGDLDGRIYPFTLRAVTEAGQSNVDAATLRAPIPVPVVSVSPEPTAPLASPVTFTAAVRGDQEIAQVQFDVNGTTTADSDAPYTFDFDPFTVAPEDYTLTVRATDADGDNGETVIPFTVAPIASRVTLDTDFGTLGPITQPVTVSVSAASQTPPQSVDYRVDGESLATATALPASFTLNPFDFAPGPHTVEFVVTDSSGVEASVTQTAEIAALPPVITIDLSALPEGDVVDPVTVTVSAEGQTPIQSIAFTSNGVTTEIEGTAETEYLIDPAQFTPGQQTTIVVVTDEAGTSAAGQIMFTAGLLAPVVTIEGIADEDILDGVRTVTVGVTGQTSIADVVLLVDMQEVGRVQSAPYTFVIDPVATFSAPGTHILSINVVNEFGASDQVDFRVTVPETVFPTATPTPSSTPDADATAAAEGLILQATTEAVATIEAGMTAQAQATADTIVSQAAQATSEREAALAQATADTVSTQEAETTAEAQATLDARSTAEAIMTNTARADLAQQRLMTAEAQATLEVQATVDAQLTQIAEQTAVAQTTLDVEATLNTTRVASTQAALTQAAATAQAFDAQETAVARETAQAELTADAEGRVTAQAEMALARESTADAQTTREAMQSATREAATLVAQVELTEVAQLTLTADAESRLTPTDEPSSTPEPATEAPTEESTEEPTEEPTGASTSAPTVEPTAEATELQPTATVFDTTSTPGSPTDIVAEGADAPDSQVALVAVVAGIVLLLLIAVLIAAARRRRNQA